MTHKQEKQKGYTFKVGKQKIYTTPLVFEFAKPIILKPRITYHFELVEKEGEIIGCNLSEENKEK